MRKIFFFIALLAIGCKKEQLVEEPPIINYSTEATLDLGANVTADFFGVVKDEAGNPVSGVSIAVGNKDATTDNNGVFMVSDASVHEKLAYVRAIKNGYFLGSRSLIPSTSATNNVRITLLTKDVVATVNSGEEATVSLPGGASIDFKGNYVGASGNVYSGAVNVAFKHMPALADATADQMPGMLYGQNRDEEAGVLETYGMIAVELFSPNGEKLQIEEGSYATIHMPVDPEQEANAPATIPLWHFDEAAGYWIEGGEASLENGEYVGDVTHFSFWNCDDFLNNCQVIGVIEDQDGNPLFFDQVRIITPISTRTGYTNANGSFFTFLPANQPITLEVLDQCGNVIQSFNLGPYSVESINNEYLALTEPSTSLQVTGILYDCDNNPVTNGYVRLNLGLEERVLPLFNGTITTSFLNCNTISTLTVQGFDFASQQETSLNTVPVVTPVTNIGNLIACNSVSEYINYTIDTNPTGFVFSPFDCNVLLDTITGLPSSRFQIDGYSFNSIIRLTGASQTVGTYNYDYNTGMTVFIPSTYLGETPDITFNLNQFGAVGEYVDVTFSGTYLDTSSVSHTISGTAHVIRDQ